MVGDAGGSREEELGRSEKVAALPAETRTEKSCAGCGLPISTGQHYVRVAVMLDTAGFELLNVLALPDGIVWSAICDTPACAGIALLKAARTEWIFTDVFGR